MVKSWSPSQGGVLSGARDAPPIQDAPQLATVLSVSAAGVQVELDLTPGHAYGPAPWSLGSYATFAAAIAGGYKPLVGDRACVVFCGSGLGSPVVLAWWR